MSDQAFQFSLAAAVAKLRRTLAYDERDIADLQRNAIFWLTTQVGTSSTVNAFAPPINATVDVSRLEQSLYLGAIGFVESVALEAAMLVEALNRVTSNAPHTLEERGYADDPLAAAGLLVLASRLGRSEIMSRVRNSIEKRSVQSPVISVILTMADRSCAYSHCEPFSRENAAHLAAVVLASHADANAAAVSFPMISARDAHSALIDGMCRGRFSLKRDLDAMVVLAALEAPGEHFAKVAVHHPERAKTMPKTILFLAANPMTTGRLRLDEEIRDIEAKLRAADYRDSLVLRSRLAARPDDLIQALNQDRPSVVHFSGHGAGSEGLVLQDEMGGHVLVRGGALRQVFKAIKGNIRVVVLNACLSHEQAQEIVGVIDCVVGMRASVGDEAAWKFAGSFYRALAFGHSVANAFEQGRSAVALAGLDDTNVPQLFVRTGVNADDIRIVDDVV